MGNNSFYQGSKWRNASINFSKANPLCLFCWVDGITEEGKVVDHIIPIDAAGAKYNPLNFQRLCMRHHSHKTRGDKDGYISDSYVYNGELLPTFTKNYKGGYIENIKPFNSTTTHTGRFRTMSGPKSDFPTYIKVIGNFLSGKTTLSKHIAAKVNYIHLDINDYRKKYSKGKSISGEYHAWNMFYNDILKQPCIIEESGASLKSERINKLPNLYTIKIDINIDVIRERMSSYKEFTPLPYYYGSVYQAVFMINKKIKQIKSDQVVSNDNSIDFIINKIIND